MTIAEQIIKDLGNPCGQTWETENNVEFTCIWYDKGHIYCDVPFRQTYEDDKDACMLSKYDVYVFKDESFIVDFDGICWDIGNDIGTANINGLVPTDEWKIHNGFKL